MYSKIATILALALNLNLENCSQGKDSGEETGLECPENAGDLGPFEFCPDTDGDGFGAPEGCVWACTTPEGFAYDATDCNDNNPASNPDMPENCLDGEDNDCDGAIDYDDDACANPDRNFGGPHLSW